MYNDIYLAVAEELVTVLPEKWEKVMLYSQITDDSYEFFFYVQVGEQFIQCYELEQEFGIPRKEIRKCFSKLNDILKSDYKEKKWYVLTYLLDKNGKFTTEYEYTDYSENSLDYKKQWKVKYLQ